MAVVGLDLESRLEIFDSVGFLLKGAKLGPSLVVLLKAYARASALSFASRSAGDMDDRWRGPLEACGDDDDSPSSRASLVTRPCVMIDQYCINGVKNETFANEIRPIGGFPKSRQSPDCFVQDG